MKIMMKRHTSTAMTRALVLFIGIAGWFIPEQASAISAFSRAYTMPCSACHSTMPMLNSFGRTFKENGYAAVRGQPQEQIEISEGALNLPKTFPFGAIFVGRPYDRKKGGDDQLRVLHEFELITAGSAFNTLSFWAEIEFEDEENFEAAFPHAQVGFHPHQAFNLLGGKADVFIADPYDTLTNLRRLTRNRRELLDQGFATGVKINDNVQFASVYGRDPWSNRIFYLATYSADIGDPEGEGPKDGTIRLAVDLLPQLMTGGFGSFGKQKVEEEAEDGTVVSRKLDFWRAGVDARADIENLTLLGVYMLSNDDLFAGGDESNNAFYVEGLYAIRNEAFQRSPIPIFQIVPLVRLDFLERNDGRDNFVDLTTNVSWYPIENFRVAVEYLQSLDRPGDEQWRTTVFFSLVV